MITTLDATLATEQNQLTRKPLCRIYSCENVDSIPFNGDVLDTESSNEFAPDVRIHSTGRLFGCFLVEATKIRYFYSDIDRTYYTFVDFVTPLVTMEEISCCEMADGNIGVIYSYSSGVTRYFKYKVITVTGAELTPAVGGTILSGAKTAYQTSIHVNCLADDSYILIYGAIEEGPRYPFYTKTSIDFATWATSNEIDGIGGQYWEKENPFILTAKTGELWLFWDQVDLLGDGGEELTNVYCTTSTLESKFATCSSPTRLTSYTQFSEVAKHPVAVQKAATDMYLIFDKVIASLTMDHDTVGWTASYSDISALSIDESTQTAYAVVSWMEMGGKTFGAVVQIDLATWSVTKAYTTSSSPPFPSYFSSSSGVWWNCVHNEGHYVAVFQDNVISVVNSSNDTITTYSFYDYTTYGISQNIEWDEYYTFWLHSKTIYKVWIDANSDRMYVLLKDDYLYDSTLQVGYIDLTETITPPAKYTWHNLFNLQDDDLPSGCYWSFLNRGGDSGFFAVYPGADLIILSWEGRHASGAQGVLLLYSLSGGGLWKTYCHSLDATFPFLGLRRCVYCNNAIYGDFTYEPDYGQADCRGLCKIDLATDTITYYRPSWASVNDYELWDIVITDDYRFVINAGSYGVTIFDGVFWTLYDNNSLPGMTKSGSENFTSQLVYNNDTRCIVSVDFSSSKGIIMFSEDGYMRQSQYKLGEYTTSWAWGETEELITGFLDYNTSAAIDPDDSGIYVFWVHKDGTELSIKWDKEQPSFDLAPYILKGSVVERQESIDVSTGAWDSSIQFSVSHGHLFDTSNSTSLLRQYLAKGRKLQQQFGERIDGVDYWEPIRIFTVSQDGECIYETGTYPDMKIEADTPRKRWEETHVVTSEYFSNVSCEGIIDDLLTTYFPTLTVSLGTWTGIEVVSYQGVDVYLADLVDLIAYHAGYCIRDGALGVVEAIKISDSETPVYNYTAVDRIFNASPNNQFSSFVNRWIVEGEEDTFTELLMTEELAAEMNATHRWNTDDKTYRVWYTNGGKIYRNPRLEPVDTVMSIGFQLLGNVSEELLDNSHNEADQTLWDTFCEIHIDSTNFTPHLVAALLAILLWANYGDAVISMFGGWTRPVGTLISFLLIQSAAWILGATVNVWYKIYGRPVVKVRRQLSMYADDDVLQSRMGQVIAEQPYSDPMCNSETACQTVANFRKMVGMGERARWGFDMVPDLRLQAGDTISVIHPFSGQKITVFITDLQTTYEKPENENSNGIYQQKIEGWRR